MSKIILFQGDSITDCGRSRENDVNVGTGYPLLVKSKLGFDAPGEYDFYNRGISGNRIVDVYARIKRDLINLKPDYMSLLIGVNDVWHEVHESPNGVSAEKFEKIYDMLISEVLEALPDIKIMIMEPFVLEGSATLANEQFPFRWDYFRTEVPLRADAAKRIAQKHSLSFIPLQEKLNEALKLAPASYWLADGVHPTAMGHQLIMNEWFKAFNNL
ncbi:MAG: SGNH/GDSL hydrolase family protein [Clostridia bacterium]|nr:SGNH/GDSL hydrolase family protein [Clostridia bacterium]